MSSRLFHAGLIGFELQGERFCDFFEFACRGESSEVVKTSGSVSKMILLKFVKAARAHATGRGQTFAIYFQVGTRGRSIWGLGAYVVVVEGQKKPKGLNWCGGKGSVWEVNVENREGAKSWFEGAGKGADPCALIQGESNTGRID